MKKVEDRKAALELANGNIIANTARKERLRRFMEATAELLPEAIEYSDDLFTATVEEIRVSKVRNGGYTLEYDFMNGERVELTK